MKNFDMVHNLTKYLKGKVTGDNLVESFAKVKEEVVVPVAGTFEVTDELVDNLGKELNIDFNVTSRDEFKRGLTVEQEHVGSIAGDVENLNVTVAKIALDHLKELPDYYTRLAAMEGSIKEGVTLGPVSSFTTDLPDSEEIGLLLGKQSSFDGNKPAAVIFPFQQENWDKVEALVRGAEETEEVAGTTYTVATVKPGVFMLYINGTSDAILPSFIVQDTDVVASLNAKPEVVEKAPAGAEYIVKGIKKSKSDVNPWAVAWGMLKKGASFRKGKHKGQKMSSVGESKRDTAFWVATSLSNDEIASDDELIQHFVEQGPMKRSTAVKLVALRNKYLKNPINKGEEFLEIESILAEAVSDKFKIIARGMVDKVAADNIARQKQGSVVTDDGDPKKFMVIVKESKVNEDFRNVKALELLKDVRSNVEDGMVSSKVEAGGKFNFALKMLDKLESLLVRDNEYVKNESVNEGLYSELKIFVDDLTAQGKSDEEIVDAAVREMPSFDKVAVVNAIKLIRAQGDVDEAKEHADFAKVRRFIARKYGASDFWAGTIFDDIWVEQIGEELGRFAHEVIEEVGLKEDEEGELLLFTFDLLEESFIKYLSGGAKNESKLNEIDKTALKEAIKAEEPDASEELINQIFANQVKLGTEITYLKDPKKDDDQKVTLGEPISKQKPQKESKLKEYRIVRFYRDDRPKEVIDTGLSLEDARAHCKDPDTKGDGWFDGYEKEDADGEPISKQKPQKESKLKEYRIVRFYRDDRPKEVIDTGLSLEDARAHCKDPDTKGDGWFDGYEKEDADESKTNEDYASWAEREKTHVWYSKLDKDLQRKLLSALVAYYMEVENMGQSSAEEHAAHHFRAANRTPENWQKFLKMLQDAIADKRKISNYDWMKTIKESKVNEAKGDKFQKPYGKNNPAVEDTCAYCGNDIGTDGVTDSKYDYCCDAHMKKGPRMFTSNEAVLKDKQKVKFQVIVGPASDEDDFTEVDVIASIADDAGCKKSEVELIKYKVVDSDYSDDLADKDDRQYDLFIDVEAFVPVRAANFLKEKGLLEAVLNEVKFVIWDKRDMKILTKVNGDPLEFPAQNAARTHVSDILGNPNRYEILARTNTSLLRPVGVESTSVKKASESAGESGTYTVYDRNTHKMVQEEGKDHAAYFTSKSLARQFIVDKLGPEKGRYEVVEEGLKEGVNQELNDLAVKYEANIDDIKGMYDSAKAIRLKSAKKPETAMLDDDDKKFVINVVKHRLELRKGKAGRGANEAKSGKVRVTAFAKDFKEEWDWDAMTELADEVGGIQLRRPVPDAHGDSDVMVISNIDLTKEQAQELFDAGDFFLGDKVWAGDSVSDIVKQLKKYVEEQEKKYE